MSTLCVCMRMCSCMCGLLGAPDSACLCLLVLGYPVHPPCLAFVLRSCAALYWPRHLSNPNVYILKCFKTYLPHFSTWEFHTWLLCHFNPLFTICSNSSHIPDSLSMHVLSIYLLHIHAHMCTCKYRLLNPFSIARVHVWPVCAYLCVCMWDLCVSICVCVCVSMLIYVYNDCVCVCVWSVYIFVFVSLCGMCVCVFLCMVVAVQCVYLCMWYICECMCVVCVYGACVCISAYVCGICVHVYLCVCACICMCDLYVYVYLCVYPYVYICVHMWNLCVSMCVCVCVCVCVCLYVHWCIMHLCLSVCVTCVYICGRERDLRVCVCLCVSVCLSVHLGMPTVIGYPITITYSFSYRHKPLWEFPHTCWNVHRCYHCPGFV